MKGLIYNILLTYFKILPIFDCRGYFTRRPREKAIKGAGFFGWVGE
jgi:hypothetical protein